MRGLLTVALAASLQVAAQPDLAVRLKSLLAEAHQAQARSDFRSAAGAYRQALAIRPDLVELWSNLGVMQYESGEYSQAEAAFRRALATKQTLFVPNLFLGLDLLQLKRPREAVPYLLAAEKINADDPQPALALGRAYHALWEPEKSRVWYEQATVLAPYNGEAWYGLGVAHFGLAEAAGEKLTGSFPKSEFVSELTASAFAEQARMPEAINAYRALLKSGTSPPRCSHTSYGFVLIRHGDPKDAEQEFSRDLQSCPAARIGMARLQFESGARDEGLAILADLASADQEAFDSSLPRFWEGLDTQQLETRLAELRQSTSALATAVAARLQQGVRSSQLFEPEQPIPESANISQLEQFSSDHFFSGHFRTVARASDRLRQTYPNHPVGWYWAVRANQKLGVAALARASEVEPDSPRIHALLGDFYVRRKMFDEARQEYSRMLAISPDSVAALAGMAAASFADGKLEDAQTSAEKALALRPDDSEINLLMGEILVAENEYAAAEPYLKRGLHARPDLLPRAHALLGRVFADTGRPKEAIRELTQGLPSDENGSVYYKLARLYQQAGDTKAANAAYEKSKQVREKHDALSQQMLTPIP